MAITTSALLAWIAAVGEPVVAPHAHAEVGVVVHEPPRGQPGVDVEVPPAAAAGVGVGLVGGRPDGGPRGWLDIGMVTSLAGEAIESLGDGSRRSRPARSQAARASFGVVLAPRPRVQIGVGLGYALQAFTSPVDERIAAQLIHAPHVVMPLVFSSRSGRISLRLRPSVGPSLPPARLARRSEHELGLGLGLAVELDLRLIGPLVLRVSAREDHQLFFPLHDARHLATLALVFDANPWTRPRP